MESTVKKQLVKFAPRGKDSFYDAVKAKVNEYFERNNISPYSNTRSHVKTAVMLSLYFVPYVVIVSGLASGSLLLFYALWLMMGTGVVGIGTCIMHDSNHGAYTKNKAVNSFLGNILNLIGGYAPNWRIQHNILHHTYTNIEGLDEDIEAGIAIRMTPEKPLHSFHRFQHIYAWFLYMLMNLYWITAKDYVMLARYHKTGLLKKEKISYSRALTHLTLLKLFYFSYAVVLPIFVAGVAWYHVVLGFVVMHLVAGFSLACIFQPAHVVETSDYSAPDESRKMENNWAIHQILNTANFAPDNKLVSWFIGGLNFQIEHHLFPHICHIHYPRLSAIVASVAREYGVPYQVMPTFRSALLAHGKMLWKLGRNKDH